MSEKSNHYLERDEAIKFIKKSYRPGITHFVRGGTFLYSQVPQDGTPGRGYDYNCNIEVSQKAALKYVKDMISDHFAEKKVKIEISVYDSEYGTGGCIFIG